MQTINIIQRDTKKTVIINISITSRVLFTLLENFTYISNMLCFKKLKNFKSRLWKISDLQELKKCTPWQCLVFRRGIFSVFGSCELQKQHVLEKYITWALSAKVITISKVYCLGCHFQTWRHGDSSSRTIMSIVWQSTMIDLSRCFVSSGQHFIYGKRLKTKTANWNSN